VIQWYWPRLDTTIQYVFGRPTAGSAQGRSSIKTRYPLFLRPLPWYVLFGTNNIVQLKCISVHLKSINQQVSVPWCTLSCRNTKNLLCVCLTSSQQVNSLEVTPDRSMIAAAGMFIITIYWPLLKSILSTNSQHRSNNLFFWGGGSLFLGYQHIRMYDLNSNNPNPVITYDGVSKNITSVGFHEDGRWMYTGGEDCMARIWDLRYSPRIRCMHGGESNANKMLTCVGLPWCF
jgi:WD40 repeat protein